LTRPCWRLWRQDLECLVGSLRRNVTNKLEAGLLLVEAESVGDRGRFPAAGNSEFGQDP
jgi:hypothetical protein